MKRRNFLKTVAITGVGLAYMPRLFAQDNTTAVSNVGEDLDLYAVLDLFEQSENLEEFEKALNDEEQGINNLDLNENGEVDYIKVDETIEENTHLIILQVEIEEGEFQDVATIEIEKNSDDEYTVQAVGTEELYGEDYIVEPVTEESSSTTTVVHVHTWPVVLVLFRPGYRAWRSPWLWRARPIWWRPFRPIARSTYRNRWRKSSRRSRYRKTTRRRSTRSRNMHSSRKKTSNRYKKSPNKQTNKKKSTTTNKKTTTNNKNKTTTKQQTNKKTTTNNKNKTTTKQQTNKKTNTKNKQKKKKK